MTSKADPALACIMGRHLFADILDAKTDALVGGWCLWCGGGTYDGDRITDDGEIIGFTPTYTVRVPDGFFRWPEDGD